MALTVAVVNAIPGAQIGHNSQHLKFGFVDVLFDSSLASGGEDASGVAAGLGWSSVLFMCEAGSAVPSGYLFKYDNDTVKLTAFQVPSQAAVTLAATVLAEAGSADVGTIAATVRFFCVGV